MTESLDEVDEPAIRDATALLQRLSGGRASGGTLWYRGQANYRWSLQSQVARNRGFLESELDMLKQFRQDASPRVRERPLSTWEWIFLAQHYGLPTRLLDWTENPMIGLYFAAQDDQAGENEPVDGTLFELDPARLNRAAFDDAPKVIMFDEDEFLASYLPGAARGPRQGPIAAVAGRYLHPAFLSAGSQVRRRKFPRRSSAPVGPVKTRPSSSGRARRDRCSRTTGAISSGKPTVRRPASDLGGPNASAPFWSSVRERWTRTVRASISMSDLRSAHSSPHRRLVKVASSV